MKTSRMVKTKPVDLAAAFRRDAERDADEHEHEAGEGIGEALVQLDAVDRRARGRAVVCAWRGARDLGAMSA